MNSARLQGLEVVYGEDADEGVTDAMVTAGWIRTGVGEMAILVGVGAARVVGSVDGGTIIVTVGTWGSGEMTLQATNKKLSQSIAGQGMIL